MKILKNFRITKDKMEEFPKVKILNNEEISLDYPVGLVDFDDLDIQELYLFRFSGSVYDFEANKQVQVSELFNKDLISKVLSNTKVFFLKEKDSDEEDKTFYEVEEVKEGEHTFVERLPKDVNIADAVLIIQGNQRILNFIDRKEVN